MLKFKCLILFNFLGGSISLPSIAPPPPPASLKWMFIPPKDRVIRSILFVDKCGNSNQHILTPDDKTLFTVTSTISHSSGYLNNSDVVLHALDSEKGIEKWNYSMIQIQNNLQTYIYVSATNSLVSYAYTNNNTLYTATLDLKNGTKLWNLTVDLKYYQNDIGNLLFFKTVEYDNTFKYSRLLIGINYNTIGNEFVIYDLKTGKSILASERTGSNIYFYDNQENIVYEVGDGSQSYISSNNITDGKKINLNLGECNTGVITGADNNFLTYTCWQRDIQGCTSSTNIMNIKNGSFLAGSLNCDGSADYARGVLWIQFFGKGYIFYVSFSQGIYQLNTINIKNSQHNWNIPTDNTYVNNIPIVLLPEKNLVLLQSSVMNDPQKSTITAHQLQNGSVVWTMEYPWYYMKKNYYDIPFNLDFCNSSYYAMKDDNETLVLLDNTYQGHAINLTSGKEIFNVSFTRELQAVDGTISQDAQTIYRISTSPIKNYLQAFNVGDDCDQYHYGQGCVEECKCIFEHGHRICDSGIFGTGQCYGACDTNWTTYNCSQCVEGVYGHNCSLAQKCHTSLGKNNQPIGGICDCGVNGTGHCSSCYPRYAGLDCLDCGDAYFGEDCLKECSCQYGKNSSGVNGTGHCLYCNESKWSGEDCNLCHGKPDAPQCMTQYHPIDCLDPIKGKSIREGCPAMCNSCENPPTPPPPPPPPTPPEPSHKYECHKDSCIPTSNSSRGGSLTECQMICGKKYWNCVRGFCIPTFSRGLNRTECQKICIRAEEI